MREKLWTLAMAMLCIVFPVMLGVTALYGCAHVKAVAVACKPTGTDVDTALAALQSDSWQSMLERFAVAKGLCVARAAVQQVIDALSGGLALSTVDSGAPSNAEVVSRGRAWLTANPN